MYTTFADDHRVPVNNAYMQMHPAQAVDSHLNPRNGSPEKLTLNGFGVKFDPKVTFPSKHTGS